jgi:hypothetical protein
VKIMSKKPKITDYNPWGGTGVQTYAPKKSQPSKWERFRGFVNTTNEKNGQAQTSFGNMEARYKKVKKNNPFAGW